MGYVACFADYVTDFKIFMEKVVSPNSVHKPKLLCHSMGGTIGALLVLDSAKLFSQVVFFAPMFGIRPALPGWFASLLLALDQGVLRLSGQSVGYFFGQKDYEDNDFTGNERTHSPSRYKVFRDEYNNNPQVQLGGVTGHWLSMAEQAMTNIENCAQAFPIPAIVFQATCDKIVDNTRQTKVARQMANTQLVKVTDAKHEILMEQDPYRQACLTQVLDFFGQT
jgi:lysophospholipase